MARGRGVDRNGRSKVRPFLKLSWDIYDWLETKRVSLAGRAVLFHLIRTHHGTNNGRLAFAVRVGERLGMSRATAARAIRELIAKGFITTEAASSFNRKDRKAAEYGLAWLPIEGRPPSLGYRNVSTGDVVHSLTREPDSLTRRTVEGRKSA